MLEQRADESADEGAKRCGEYAFVVFVDNNGSCGRRRRGRRGTRVGVVPVVVRSRRGRSVAMSVLGRMRLVVRGGARSGSVSSAVGSREGGCADCGACEARDQEFLEVVVHIAPSLSFWDVAQETISRLHRVRHEARRLLTSFFATPLRRRRWGCPPPHVIASAVRHHA